MNYLDLFSGIGGFASGITKAFENCGGENGIYRTPRQVQGEEVRQEEVGGSGDGCVQAGGSLRCDRQSSQKCFGKHYFSEIDRYASRVYKRHFPEAIELGDIRNVDPGQLGKIDLITFGFPCQDLSIAGNRKGIGGSRSGLFFEAIRLIRELKPSLFVFENVKGLFSSGEGRDFVEVLRTIADIGLYECEWQLLNTKWVLPQNRERIYFIGHLAGGSSRKVFPIAHTNEKNVKHGGIDFHKTTLFTDINCRIAKGQTIQPVLTPNREEKRQNGRRMKEDGEEMFTLTGQDKHGVFNGQRIRRLTPTECERLQGFPDGWTEGESDSQQYKCCGNAVSVPIVQMIFERLFKKEIK